MKNIELTRLKYKFNTKPLLIGGMAMDYYGLRKAGRDIDFIIDKVDYINLSKLYPDNKKDIFGDLGIIVYDFELWTTICSFDYNFFSENAIELKGYKVISLEKLLFLKALGMKVPKYLEDLRLIVQKILKDKYDLDDSFTY